MGSSTVDEPTAKTLGDDSRRLTAGHVARWLLAQRELSVLAALILIVLFFALAAPSFLTLRNAINVARQTAELGIVAIAVGILIISGEFDLSVGSVYGLVGVAVALLTKNFSINIWTAFTAGLMLSGILGLLNGAITTKTEISSLITTLGSMMVFRGIALVISNGWPIASLPDSMFYEVFGRARVFGLIPVPVVWLVLIGLAGWYLLHRTSFGIKVFATGGSREASRVSGIDTDRVKVIAFMMTSVAAGLASMVSLSYLKSVTPTQGIGLELEVIAAAVIGGTSLSGGVGSVAGTVLGALTISTVRNGLVMLGTSAYWQDALIGLILMLAVITNVQLQKKRSMSR